MAFGPEGEFLCIEFSALDIAQPFVCVCPDSPLPLDLHLEMLWRLGLGGDSDNGRALIVRNLRVVPALGALALLAAGSLVLLRRREA